jgi:dTDP-4-amino-4,6-dideoxygalactose transaminase
LAKSQLGGWRYDVVSPGYKCNMTDIQAAMGLVELGRYRDDMLVRRKAIFDRYSSGFGAKEWGVIPTYENEQRTSSYHVYMLRIANISEQQRDRIMDKIFAQQVSVNVHFQPLPLLSYYNEIGYKMEDYPQAFACYASEISVPVYYSLSDDEVDTVIAAVTQAVEEEIN